MKIFWFTVSHPALPDPLPEALRTIVVAAASEVHARHLAREHLKRSYRYGAEYGTGLPDEPEAVLNYSLELIATDSASEDAEAGVAPVAEEPDQKLDREVGRGVPRFDFEITLTPRRWFAKEQTATGHNVIGAEAIEAISELFAHAAGAGGQKDEPADPRHEILEEMSEAAGEDEEDVPDPADMVPALRGSGVVVRQPGLVGALPGRAFPGYVQVDYPELEGVGDSTIVPLSEPDGRVATASREVLLRTLTGDRELLRLIWTHLAANRDRLPEVMHVPVQRLQGGAVRLPELHLVLGQYDSANLARFRRGWRAFNTEKMREVANEFREALRLTLRYLLGEAGWELSQ